MRIVTASSALTMIALVGCASSPASPESEIGESTSAASVGGSGGGSTIGTFGGGGKTVNATAQFEFFTTGTCLSVLGDAAVSGAPIVTATCSNSPSQRFVPYPDQTLRANGNLDLCVGVFNNDYALGALELLPCAGVHPTPTWAFWGARLAANSSLNCVTVDALYSGTTSTVHVKPCAERASENQTLFPIGAPLRFEATSTASDYPICMSISGYSGFPSLARCALSDTNQQFKLSSGFQILWQGQCLGTYQPNGQYFTSPLLQLQTCNGSPGQGWWLDQEGVDTMIENDAFPSSALLSAYPEGGGLALGGDGEASQPIILGSIETTNISWELHIDVPGWVGF